MTPIHQDDAGLLQKARSGCRKSLGELLDPNRDFLLRIARRRIGAEFSAKLSPSDVVQSSLLAASRDFHQFRGQTTQELRAWLAQIVTRQLIDGLRRFLDAEKRRSDSANHRNASVLDQVIDEGETPSRLAILQEDAERLVTAIDSLPKDLRDVLEARYLEDLTFTEIAQRLDASVTTCRRRWLEAVDAIRHRMQHDRSGHS